MLGITNQCQYPSSTVACVRPSPAEDDGIPWRRQSPACYASAPKRDTARQQTLNIK